MIRRRTITLSRSLALLVVLACMPLAPWAARAQDENPWLERRVLNMAHRGGRAEAPEHTLYAYKVALPKLVTLLEVDVHLSADGVLVVHHDATVDRVTNGTGPISSFTLAELKALDNAYWYASVCGGRCTGQPPEDYDFRGVATGDAPPPAGFEATDFQIMTMREVLDAFPRVLLSIEIKGSAPDSVPAAEQLGDLLTEFGRETDVMIASFDDPTTAAFKAHTPNVHTTPGLDETLAFVGAPGPLPAHRAFQVPRTFDTIFVPPLIIDPAHANDLAVYFFIDPGEENETVYNELIDAGAEGIITDRPSDLQTVLDQRGDAYKYKQLMPTKVALLKSSPAVKLVSKAQTLLPIVAPDQTPNSLSVRNNGGEMLDPLTGGTWKLLGKPDAPKGYKYVNKSAPAGGACKVLLIKDSGIKAVCKDKGAIPDPLADGTNGNLEISLVLGIDRYCAEGPAPHATEKEGKLIKVKDAAAPAACAGP